MTQETIRSKRPVKNVPDDESAKAAKSRDREQQRLHQLCESVLVEARSLAAQPVSSSPEETAASTPEETEYGAIVTDKFRRQGFSL